METESEPEICQSSIPMKRQLETEPETHVAPQDPEQQDPAAAVTVLVQPPTSPDSLNNEHDKSNPVLPNGASRQVSPALSSTSSLTELSSTMSPSVLDGTAQSKESSNGQPATKRRKLTFAEKEQRRAEKEQRREEKERKEQERAEQKAKRDEQKQIKDEERRKNNELKEAKRREKDLEKERKEQEKRKIEEEKEKKERAQSRINAFFIKPHAPSGLSNQDDGPDLQNSSADTDMAGVKTEADLKDPALTRTDYQRTFLPFSLASNTAVAPINRFSWDDDARLHIQVNVEKSLESDINVSLEQSLGLQMPCLRLRNGDHLTVKEIIKQLSLSDSDNFSGTSKTSKTPLEELQSMPMKYIFFTQDVRPPYVGTYTKLTPKQLSRAGRNPFARVRPDTDYNYDSEAEWEEPEEGEELLSEGDSDLESCDETDEMDDFLDDHDADGQAPKRKVVSGDLDPVCSGLCYENYTGISRDSSGQKSGLRRYKLDLLQDFIRLPIDPFCSSYWPDSEQDNVKKAKATSSSETQTSRQPLQARPNFFSNVQPSKDTATDEKVSKPDNVIKVSGGRLLEGQQLEEFRTAVIGSEHNKIGLLAILKKQFPKVTNKVLQDTLAAIAERKGRSEADKRWVLRGNS